MALLACVQVAAGQGAQTVVAALPSDLTELSLEQLLNIEVTSVTKTSIPLARAAAAIFVLTGEEIRRSGARSIAEALRAVPGLHVARTNTSTQYYAISARGFNSGTSDKLEVLLDGRSVYTPLFSGVFWDTLDTYLPDIDRIEVIRGPGAALWGANAVNGVINIVTRNAADTQGTQLTGGGGDDERGFGGFRTGTRLGDRGSIRFYAQALDRADGKLRSGAPAPTALQLRQGGFRADWAGEHGFTVLGDLYSGARGSETGDMDLDGGNLQGRWTWRSSAESELSLRAYLDRYHRMIPAVYEETRNTGDVQLEHRLAVGRRHDVLYGLGYRESRDETEGPPRAFIFEPADLRLRTYSAFVQDQIGFAGNAAELTLGSKFEHNDYTGFEAQPSIRLGWQLHERLFTWGAVSRAVRTPNRLDTGLAVFCPPGFPVCTAGQQYLIGNPQVAAETLLAYEWGLRAWTVENFSADLAVFYNDYTSLRSTEASPPFGRFGDSLEGSGRGAELNLTWRPAAPVDVRAFYSFLDLSLEKKAGSTDRGTAEVVEGNNPRNMAGLDVAWRPASRVTVNGLLRYVDELPASNIPDYIDLNLRVAYRLHSNWELALAGRNLLDDHHPEFGIDIPGRLEAERGVFLQLDGFLP